MVDVDVDDVDVDDIDDVDKVVDVVNVEDMDDSRPGGPPSSKPGGPFPCRPGGPFPSRPGGPSPCKPGGPFSSSPGGPSSSDSSRRLFSKPYEFKFPVSVVRPGKLPFTPSSKTWSLPLFLLSLGRGSLIFSCDGPHGHVESCSCKRD